MKLVFYKALIEIHIKQKFSIYHTVVVNAFLYSFLDKSIYINQLPLFEISVNKVCLLQ